MKRPPGRIRYSAVARGAIAMMRGQQGEDTTMIYTYRAENYCAACGDALRRSLPVPHGCDPDNDSTYDSDDYPKPYCGTNETDSPEHCASGEHCRNAIELLPADAPLFGAETRHIGCMLTDCLTAEGIDYLRETLRGDEATTPYQDALHAEWRAMFADELA